MMAYSIRVAATVAATVAVTTATGVAPAQASVPEMLGLGANNIAQGGAVTASVDDGFAAYYNPAGLTLGRGIRLSVDYVMGQAALEGFSGIVYDRNGDGIARDPHGGPEYGSVGTDYRARPEGSADPFYTSGLQFAAAIPLGKYFALGLAGYLPKEGAFRIQIEDPELPYYVMYRNRNNRATFNPALSVQPLRDLHIGIGAQVMGATETSAQLSLHTELHAFASSADGATASEETHPEEIRTYVATRVDHMSSRLVYRATPNVGIMLSGGAFVPTTSPWYRILNRFAVGASYRGAYGVPTSANVRVGTSGHFRFDDATASVSPLLDAPIELNLAEPTVAFSPAQFAIGLRAGVGPLNVIADGTWTQWSKFEELTVPFQRIEAQSLAGAELILETGRPLPPAAFTDTWSMRVGTYTQLAGWDVGTLLRHITVVGRAGFAYIPSPVPDQGGRTNYVDSDRRVVSAGIGVEVGRLPGVTDEPVQFNVAFQHHQLQRRTMAKDPEHLQDEDGDGLLDYPRGYPLSGSITSAGSIWAATFGVRIALSGT